MSNIMEYEVISEKINGLEKELDTFIQAVHEIKEIRKAAGTLPDDLKMNKAEIEERKKELEKLISSANNQFVNFGQRAEDMISNIKKKNDEMADEAGSKISDLLGKIESSIQARTGDHNITEDIMKEIDTSINEVEERFYKSLTRQKIAIVIMSALFIASMSFMTYLFFIQ